MAKCTIIWDKTISAYKLTMPFNAKVVDFLKSQIPHSERTWDSNSKTWTFTEQYLDGTIQLCALVFGSSEVVVVTRSKIEEAQAKANQQPTVRSSSPLGDTCLTFLKDIGYDAAKQAYRKAAITYHPDVIKGNPQLLNKMAEINALWTRIEKEVYGK